VWALLVRGYQKPITRFGPRSGGRLPLGAACDAALESVMLGGVW
jgi:hypothetical protein